MDLIYTNAEKIDQGVLHAYSFDLSYGAKENNFELTLGKNEPLLDYGAFVYVEGTEYGGIVDAKKSSTNGETITHMGRTWHGVLNSKIIRPKAAADYFTVSGDANAVLRSLISNMVLFRFFTVVDDDSGINIPEYRFRYHKGYDGIRDMLASVGAKLKISCVNHVVHLGAVPIVDYTESPLDGDNAVLTVEHHEIKVNHLVCLGQGELASRQVIDLYVDQFGQIGDTYYDHYFTGFDEVIDVYDNVNAESRDVLYEEGVKRLTELRDNDTADISIVEQDAQSYDIGDIVGAHDVTSGISSTSTVSQKIIRINNGVVSTEYEIGVDHA